MSWFWAPWDKINTKLYLISSHVEKIYILLQEEKRMSHELADKIKELAKKVDTIGDKVIERLLIVQQKLDEALQNAVDYPALRDAVEQASAGIANQIAEFEAVLPAEPPAPPTE